MCALAVAVAAAACSTVNITTDWDRGVDFRRFRTFQVVGGRVINEGVEGGQGPFSLTSYPDAVARKDAIVAAVKSRPMPPWPPAGCCAAYRRDASLSTEEMARIATWAEVGAAE